MDLGLDPGKILPLWPRTQVAAPDGEIGPRSACRPGLPRRRLGKPRRRHDTCDFGVRTCTPTSEPTMNRIARHLPALALAAGASFSPGEGTLHAQGHVAVSASASIGPLFAGVSFGIGDPLPSGSVFAPLPYFGGSYGYDEGGYGIYSEGRGDGWSGGYWDASYIRLRPCWESGWGWAYRIECDPFWSTYRYGWYRPYWGHSFAWGWSAGWSSAIWVDPFYRPWGLFTAHDPWGWYWDGYRDGYWDAHRWGGGRWNRGRYGFVHRGGYGYDGYGYGRAGAGVGYKSDPRSGGDNRGDVGRKAVPRNPATSGDGGRPDRIVGTGARVATPRTGTDVRDGATRPPSRVGVTPSRRAVPRDGGAARTGETRPPSRVGVPSGEGRAGVGTLPSRRFSPPTRSAVGRTSTTARSTRSRAGSDDGGRAASDRTATMRTPTSRTVPATSRVPTRATPPRASSSSARPRTPPRASSSSARPRTPPRASSSSARPRTPPRASSSSARPRTPPRASSSSARPRTPPRASSSSARPRTPPRASTGSSRSSRPTAKRGSGR